MTKQQQTKIVDALAETRRFIAKEEARGEFNRPAAVADLLAKYKAHEQKLIAMLIA